MHRQGLLHRHRSSVTVSRLIAHPEVLPLVSAWFKHEWPDWYGPGGPGDVEGDVRSFANEGGLPLGVIAFSDGAPCGAAALKAESIPTHTHLAPWAAAGFVVPRLRGQGIGARLLSALEMEAKNLGYSSIYCGTATANALLRRAQWRVIDRVQLRGEDVSVYEKAL
jgi:GNAT superfamily N-acetyltransferase